MKCVEHHDYYLCREKFHSMKTGHLKCTKCLTMNKKKMLHIHCGRSSNEFSTYSSVIAFNEPNLYYMHTVKPYKMPINKFIYSEISISMCHFIENFSLKYAFISIYYYIEVLMKKKKKKKLCAFDMGHLRALNSHRIQLVLIIIAVCMPHQ